MEVFKENELAVLVNSLKKIHEVQKCNSPPSRGGCVEQSQTSTASHKLFCCLKVRKEGSSQKPHIIMGRYKGTLFRDTLREAQKQKRTQFPRGTEKQNTLIL